MKHICGTIISQFSKRVHDKKIPNLLQHIIYKIYKSWTRRTLAVGHLAEMVNCMENLELITAQNVKQRRVEGRGCMEYDVRNALHTATYLWIDFHQKTLIFPKFLLGGWLYKTSILYYC